MTKMINPAPGGWFVRGWIPGDHRGTDLGWYNADVDGSRRIVAAAAGTVISESVGGGYNDGWGNQYVIDHGHGIFTTYNHLATETMQLDVGQRVEAGTYVGQMGATGKTNGEVHLHFEVRVGGPGADNRVDPGPWLDGSKEIPGDEQLLDYQRRVTGDGVYERTGPGTQYARTGADREFAAGDVLDFKAWTRGEVITLNGVTSDVWYQGRYAEKWFSAACFTSQSTAGLAEVSFVPPTVPPTAPDPSRPSDAEIEAAHTPPMVTPAAADWPSWIRYEEHLDPDVTPRTNTDAAAYYGAEYAPVESHTHWWGEPGNAGTHDSNVRHFIESAELSVNFVVSAARVTLMVPLNKLAFTTGRRNPYGWKTENDPALTDAGYLTLGFVHYLVEKLNPHLQGEAIRLHKEFQNTSCSGIDVARVRSIAEQFRTGALDPATGRAPVTPADPEPPSNPDDKPVTVGWLKQLFEAIVAAVRAFFGGQK